MTNDPLPTAPIAQGAAEGQAPRAVRSLPTPARAGMAVLATLLALVAGAAPGTAGAAALRAKRVADKRVDARTQARLGRALQTAWASTWAPGVIAGVWIGDRGWTAALGSAQRAAGPRPLLVDHTRIGSVTKTMIGTVVLELVDRHKLRLDQSIARWFPQLPDAGEITIRELGDMSSGIASYTTNTTITDRYFSRPTMSWMPSQLIAGGAALPRTFTPGDGFDYSDTNFVMLGRILEMVTHKPLAQLFRTMLFKPLGMNASSYPTGNRLPSPYLRGYTIQGSDSGNVLDSTNWSPSFAAGAGQAISTLGDLHRWTVAVGTGRLLTPATQRARLIPNPASAAGGREYLFALGRDHGWLVHEGEIPGYNTQIAYLPALKATIVVIANADISNAKLVTPVAAIFHALARVIAPGNVPTG
jgi:D-alanyl-D-alanine carboxypeptidase